MNKKQLKQLKEHIAKYGGATLTSAGVITALSAGYMCSIYGYEKKTSLKRLNKRLLNKYFRKARNIGAYVGAWLDNDILYLDLSKQYATKAQAISEGLKNKQLAIYDNANAQSVYIK